MNYRVFILFLTFPLLLSSQKSAAVYYESYAQYKNEISHKLKECNRFSDSLICIRNAVHGFYRSGRKNSDLENLGYENSWQWSAERWFKMFNQDSISAQCGGAANFLCQMLQEFNIESLTISIGPKDKEDKSGHIQVLASSTKSNCTDFNSFYILDPTFNFHYQANGQMLSLGEMLSMKNKDQIHINSGTNFGLRLQKSPYINPFLPEVQRHSENKKFRSRNSNVKHLIQAPRSIEHYLNRGFKKLYRDILEEYGYQSDFSEYEDFKFTILAIRGVYNSSCNEEIFDQYCILRELAYQ